MSIFARILLIVLFETLKFVRVGDSHVMSRKLQFSLAENTE